MTPHVLLAIETSGTPASIALRMADQPVVQRTLTNERRSTSTLLPAIDTLLRERALRMRDIDVFCFSCGPGSFTGLRIAAAIARMVQSSLRCSVVAVPTLEVIATQAVEGLSDSAFSSIVSLLDARSGRVYGARYEKDRTALRECEPAGVYDSTTWLDTLTRPAVISGAGITTHREACEATGAVLAEESRWLPQAATVARLGAQRSEDGAFCDPGDITPLYLRPPACEEVYEERRAAARAKRGE